MIPSCRTAISCRLIRGWSTLRPDPQDTQTNSVVARHLAKCAACQVFFAEHSHLDAALRAEAAQMRIQSDGLDERIVAALNVHRQSSDDKGAKFKLRFSGWALGLTGLAIACVLFVAAIRNNPNMNQGKDAAGPFIASADNTPPDELRAVISATTEKVELAWGKLKPAASAAMREEPLNEELRFVAQDAKRALDFFAKNFLPQASPNPSAENNG